MKESVMIAIESKKLADMGIEQDDLYTELFFNAKYFVGYRITEGDDNDPPVIVFYLGADSFMTKYNKENILKFNKILNEGL